MRLKHPYVLPHIFVFIGVSGSGKSTLGRAWASFLGIPFLDGDDYHSPKSIRKMRMGIPLEDGDRWEWIDRLNREICGHIGNNGCVLACSALKASYRERLSIGLGGSVTFVYLSGSKELIRSRIQRRSGHFMPAELLDSQFETLEEPSPDQAFKIDIGPDPDRILELLKNLFTEATS